jgi:hypothetical protein
MKCQSPIQSCRSLQALYLCKRLKSSPKTRDHVRNDHVTIFFVDIQKLGQQSKKLLIEICQQYKDVIGKISFVYTVQSET